MVDLYGKDKGNISLPEKLRSSDVRILKPEDEEEQPMINLPKATYESIINDLHKRIEQLQIRNEDLENFCEDVKNNSEKTTEAEIEIVELNNNIAVETKKVGELKKKCDAIEADRETEKSNHLEKVNLMEEKFEKIRKQLYSEIKAINAKVNMIDEYRLVDESLRAKLNQQTEATVRKEEEMQNILRQLHYKAKIHRENLKNEAYKQILDASETFQLKLKDTVSPTIQRLMRENIVLENELARLWNDHSNMEDDQFKYSNRTEEYYEEKKEAKTHTKRRLITSKIQSLLINKLRSVHSVVKEELSKSFEPPKDFETQYLTLLENTKNSEYQTENLRKRKLEVMLYQEKLKLASANEFKVRTTFTLKKIIDALSNLKGTVNSVLMNNEQNINKELQNMDLETFASHLLHIIEDCESNKWVFNTDSIETVADSTYVYAKGDLGFEPKHVEIFEQVCPETEEARSTSVFSTLEILKELEKLPDKPDDQHQSLSSQKSMHNSASTDISNSSVAVRSISEVSKKESQDIENEYETISMEDDIEEEEEEEEEDDYYNEEEREISENEENELEYEVQDRNI